MQSHSVFFREAGSGPGVVCLHSNASSSGQWRSLMDMLAPRFHVLAADSYGAGKSPPWPSDRKVGLREEVALIEPVFDRAGENFTLVGHSYGAAIALIAALEQPERIQSLVLYEPTLFSLLDAESPLPNDADGIRNAVADALLALEAGDANAAARHFIDYWMGRGTWNQMPQRNKPAITASIANIGGWSTALLSEPTPLQAFSALDIPVLFMIGKQSPPSSRGVARLLTGALPQVEVVEFEDLGHMGPVTHPDVVNQSILRFLERDEGRATFSQTLIS